MTDNPKSSRSGKRWIRALLIVIPMFVVMHWWNQWQIRHDLGKMPPERRPWRVWQTFTSTAGRFSVSMPGTPEEENHERVEAAPGLSMKVVGFSGRDGASEYAIFYADYPSLVRFGFTDEQLLMVYRDNAVHKFGKVSNDRRLESNGKLGREFSVLHELTLYHYQFWIDGPRYYQLMIATRAAGESADKAQQFFSSFRISNAESERH